MKRVRWYQEKVQSGESLGKKELLELAEAPLSELCQAADEIRRSFCGNSFDICAVISAKGGVCSEDCAFCAQSGHNPSCLEVPKFPLLSTEQLVEDARQKEKKNMMAYGIVVSGRALPTEEVDRLCDSLWQMKKQTKVRLCGSLGLLDSESMEKLKAAGLQMLHNNLESSETYFRQMCTTHTYEEKKRTIRAAKAVGLSVCSGALFGIGETMEDRIELALEERELGTTSIPINMLDPVQGTPFEKTQPLDNPEMQRIVALFRFALPTAFIRLAAGREYLPDKGKSCFLSGANAAISGDFLTTLGISIDTDLEMLREIGYEV